MKDSRNLRRAVVLAAISVVLFATALAKTDPDASRPQAARPASGAATSTPTTTTTAPPAPADCGNPVASYAPVGPQPAPGAMPPATKMAEIAARGRLIVGVSADTLLFGFRNPLTGQLEGFDIDMAKAVATAIFGAPNVEFKAMSYAKRIPSLQDKSVDMVADVMTINCARWQTIAFSTEYFAAGQKVLVRSDSPATSMTDLAGQVVCVTKGSTNIEEMSKYPEVYALGVDDVSDCMVKFQSGEVAGVTGDDTVLAGFVTQDPYAKIIGPPMTAEPYGLGVNSAHPEFVRFINQVLEDMRADGRWAALFQKWMGTPAPPPPPAVYGRRP